MSQKQLKVFVNYRRADEAVFVELMRTWFMLRYGRENVFMDFDTIPPFTLFEDFIRQKVAECDVVVSVIGPRWLELLQQKEAAGQPDFVRIELEEALRHGKVIAPICIQGGRIPADDGVPTSLRSIFKRNIPELKAGRDIINNIGWIMDAMEAELERQGVKRDVATPDVSDVLPNEPSQQFNVHEAIDNFYAAQKANDLPRALAWLAQIRASGVVVPAFFKVEQRETEIRARIREEEEERRRREVAEYHYQVVRIMMKHGEPADDIFAALQEVWQVYTGYDPDGLANKLRPQPKVSRQTLSSPDILLPDMSKILPAPFEWCPVTAGQVTIEYGDWKDGKYIVSSKQPFDVPAFAMAKYPITNAQYQVFVDANDGYRDAKWWDYSNEAAGWRKQNSQPQKTGFAGDDLPRTNVSWYNAVAFCRWLNARTNHAMQIILPTEQGWQRAAQGDDGREYPWGNKFDKERCNTEESGIGQVTPVTKYANGKSPFEVYDMSGNVWEWCLTTWEGDSTDIQGDSRRVLRGGSWYFVNHFARCASRLGTFRATGTTSSGFECGLPLFCNSEL